MEIDNFHSGYVFTSSKLYFSHAHVLCFHELGFLPFFRGLNNFYGLFHRFFHGKVLHFTVLKLAFFTGNQNCHEKINNETHKGYSYTVSRHSKPVFFFFWKTVFFLCVFFFPVKVHNVIHSFDLRSVFFFFGAGKKNTAFSFNQSIFSKNE